jgi:hypothetical protein
MLFVTYGEQDGRCRREPGKWKRRRIPTAFLCPQRQPEKAGAEDEGQDKGDGHVREGPGSGGDALLELLLDLSGLREAAQLFLGEDEVVSHGDFEDAPMAADQLRLDGELLLDFSRQTGGAGVVVSASAVLDGDSCRHSLLLSRPL